MLRIKEDFQHTIEIEKSRFICYVHRYFDDVEAKEYVLSIKRLHPHANHHCYAYVIGEHHEISRSNDDGEPSGTAGLPMLESLRLSGIHDCICVVVRYFGGIKLGAGGLVRAYSSIVSESLRLAPCVQLTHVYHYHMTFGYEYIGKFDYLLANKNAIFLNKEYGELVDYWFYVRDTNFLSEVQEISSGTIVPELLGETIIELNQEL